MNTFPKTERLCSRKQIERLFAQGRGFVCFPYSVRWLFENPDTGRTEETRKEGKSGVTCPPPVKVLISVSKRRFSRAVDRNRVKRLTRECYRLHKECLYDGIADVKPCPILLSLSYIDTQLPDFQYLSHKFDTLVERLQKEVANAQVSKVD